MAEVQFEENMNEIRNYLGAVQNCKRYVLQLPEALSKLLHLVNMSTKVLEELCTYDDTPPAVQEQCACSRRQMVTFYEGAGLKMLQQSIDTVVHQRLQALEELSLKAFTECKRRREARAKYLSTTTGRLPFGLTAPNEEKILRHKEEYTVSDGRYRQACSELARYRFEEVGVMQADFFSGYSAMFALLTNALNLPTDVAIPSSLRYPARLRYRSNSGLNREVDQSGNGLNGYLLPHLPQLMLQPSPPNRHQSNGSANSVAGGSANGRRASATALPGGRENPPPSPNLPSAVRRHLSDSLRKPDSNASAMERPLSFSQVSRSTSEVVEGIPVLRRDVLCVSEQQQHYHCTYYDLFSSPPSALVAQGEERSTSEHRGPTPARVSSASTLDNYDNISAPSWMADEAAEDYSIYMGSSREV